MSFLLKYFEKTSTLKSIILASNSIHDEGAKIFAKAIAKNMSIVHVDLTNNGIKNDGFLFGITLFD